MLLRKRKDDSAFKRGIVGLVSPDVIRLAELRGYVSSFNGYSNLGRSFEFFARGKDREAQKAVEIDKQIAGGSDAHLLFFLDDVLDLKFQVKTEEEIRFKNLAPRLRMLFHFTLDSLSDEISDPEFRRALVRMEVEVNCASKHAMMRIGSFGGNRLIDYLLSDSDDDRIFALEQFEYLHSHQMNAYDSAYAAVRLATKKANRNDIRHKLIQLQHLIERTNPSAVLPTIVQEVIGKIAGKLDPIDSLRTSIDKWKLDTTAACVLSLNVSISLRDSGDSAASKQILGESAKYAGNDLIFKACIARELGDVISAAHLLFERTSQFTSKSMLDETERYYATEGACRLIFQTDSQIWARELSVQDTRFTKLHLDDSARQVREWLAYRDGFGNYVQTKIETAKETPFDSKELKISQRRKSVRFFLEGTRSNFRRKFGTGVRWFEISAQGNDAPWINGSRALFSAIDSSLSLLQFRIDSPRAKKLILTTTRNFEKAAELLRSQYPIALSLVFRAVINTPTKIHGRAVSDLTTAIRILGQKTPELVELNRILEEIRWEFVEALCGNRSIRLSVLKEFWGRVVRLAPLLDEVISDEGRVDSFLFRLVNLREFLPLEFSVEGMLAVDDSNARGRILEDMVAEIVTKCAGLKLVDIRHTNDYEEIDLIVAVTKASPVLDQWGPIILIECKNWRDKVGTAPIATFHSKIVTKKGGIRLGIVFSPSGFTEGVDEQVARFPETIVLAFGLNELKNLIFGKTSLYNLIEDRIPFALLA